MILATGGAGKIFPFTTNGNIKTGDGMALAYRAGVALKDMEFVQYHPTGLPGTGILITEASRGEGGYLVNKEGERFLVTRDYGVGTEGGARPARHDLARDHAGDRGRPRLQGAATASTCTSTCATSARRRSSKRLPFVRELAKTYVGVDPVHEPIPIRPVVHYMMGGVDTDIDGATPLPGLYAAGETACVSLNGANRLGSNSLTECLVFGARAGRDAVRVRARHASAGNEARAAPRRARTRRRASTRCAARSAAARSSPQHPHAS